MPGARATVQTLEVLGRHADAVAEDLDALAAGGLAADGAVGQVPDRTIREAEAGDEVVLADRIGSCRSAARRR